MRLKSDPVTGSKTQSWLRLCRKIKDNSRFITAPFRETKAFEKLYNQRTSVERTFGDLKDNYNLDNIRVAKMARTKVFMDLSCIALIASRLSDAASKEKTTKRTVSIMLPLFQTFKIMKDCDGSDECAKPWNRGYYSMEKAICTLFFPKISRKICVSPKIHGGQSKNQNDRKFAGNKK